MYVFCYFVATADLALYKIDVPHLFLVTNYWHETQEPVPPFAQFATTVCSLLNDPFTTSFLTLDPCHCTVVILE